MVQEKEGTETKTPEPPKDKDTSPEVEEAAAVDDDVNNDVNDSNKNGDDPQAAVAPTNEADKEDDGGATATSQEEAKVATIQVKTEPDARAESAVVPEVNVESNREPQQEQQQDRQEEKEQEAATTAPAAAAVENDDDDHNDHPPAGPTFEASVDDPPEADADAEHDADDADVDDQAGPTLQFTFQQNTDDHDVPEAQEEENENEKPPTSARKRKRAGKTQEEKEEEYRLLHTTVVYEDTDPQTIADKKIVSGTKVESVLERALTNLLNGKEVHISKLMSEITKLKGFISKRKQTYKRKRKDESAPTRALSAYNIFVQDQFEKLAKKNDAALQSTDTNAQLERVPPANLVAKTGGLWKNLPDDEKEKYRERAKRDRKRYDEQMGKYQPPDKQANRKRNKTGYNMFFSAHVTRLKQSEMGVPSERGSVARLVGTAWKLLSAEEKQYYEREADKHNGMNPVDKGEEDKDGKKSSVDDVQQQAAQHAQQQAAVQQQQAAQVQNPYDMHASAAAAQYHELSTAAGYAAMAQQHDPRTAAAHHQYYYGQQHAAHAYHYDYSGHHAAQQQAHQQQQQQQGGHPQHSRASRQQYQYSQHAPAHGYYDK